MLDRLGTFAKFNNTQSYVNQIQQRAFDLQTQISSGKKSQTYSGIYQESGRLVSLEATQSRTKQFMDAITLVGTRMNTMEVQMNSLLDNAIQLKSTLVSAVNNGNAAFMALGEQADQLLQQTGNVLNTRDGDVYLFAGTRTDTAPVDFTQMTAVPDALTIDTEYYQGDQNKLTVKIDNDFTLEYGIKADDPAFETYIRGLRIIKANPSDPVKLREAMDLIDDAIGGLNKNISQLGAKSKALDVARIRHEDNKTVLATSIGNIEDTNIVEATSRLSSEETILQAAYLTISRISRLSLVQFLN